MKRQPGKGRNYLEHVFPQHLWCGLSVYPDWCGIVSLVVSGDLLAPSCAPGSISQGGGAVRGALPRYPKQSHHTTAQQAWHHIILQVPIPSAYLHSWSFAILIYPDSTALGVQTEGMKPTSRFIATHRLKAMQYSSNSACACLELLLDAV